MWRYVSEDSYGFTWIDIDDTFPRIKVTAGYLTTVYYDRDILFCGWTVRKLQVVVCESYLYELFFAEEFINITYDLMVFIKIYQGTNTVKSRVYLDVFLCKQLHRGPKLSWFYFGLLWLVLYSEFYGTLTIIQRRVSLIVHLDQIDTESNTVIT